MATLGSMLSRLESLNIREIASQSIYENRDLIKAQQIDQLKHGVRKDGKKIGKYRNPDGAYARKKHQQNPLAGLGNVDLILKGEFSGDIFVDVRRDEFVIDSADTKAGELIAKYGDPMGLTDESGSKVVREGLQPTAVRITRQRMKL